MAHNPVVDGAEVLRPHCPECGTRVEGEGPTLHSDEVFECDDCELRFRVTAERLPRNTPTAMPSDRD